MLRNGNRETKIRKENVKENLGLRLHTIWNNKNKYLRAEQEFYQQQSDPSQYDTTF